MKQFIKIIIILFLPLYACNFDKSNPQKIRIGDDSDYIAIADTVITDVVILNPNNDKWTDYTLRNLNREELVDKIFESVYSGDLKPYEFFHEKPLTIDDIKTLEKDPEFSRDKIGKVQFEEAWYYDNKNQRMIKKVHSIMLAYEKYNSLGELKGYKPAFKVYLKK